MGRKGVKNMKVTTFIILCIMALLSGITALNSKYGVMQRVKKEEGKEKNILENLFSPENLNAVSFNKMQTLGIIVSVIVFTVSVAGMIILSLI